jgi:heme/copper-type cytochrome/quinol oxidase subunit 4
MKNTKNEKRWQILVIICGIIMTVAGFWLISTGNGVEKLLPMGIMICGLIIAVSGIYNYLKAKQS